MFIHKSLHSQLIKQSRNRIREKQKHSGDGGGKRPIKPRNASRLRLLVEPAEHLGPEVALQLGVLQGREFALEDLPELLFVFVIVHFVGHFAAASKPRELSFLRSMRTARKTRTLTSEAEMPAASAISL